MIHFTPRTGHRFTVALVFVLILVSSTGPLIGQQPHPARSPQQQPHDPLQQLLLPPDLVMGHQAAIGLTAAQRETLIRELQSAESDMVPLQVEVGEASEALAVLLSSSRVDEGRVLEQAKIVMERETRARTRHLSLLVRIKNLLTPEQQEHLQNLRRKGSR